MSSDTPKKMVRFDFPPGASAKEIAEALKKAHAEIMANKAKARPAARDEAKGLTDGKDTTS